MVQFSISKKSLLVAVKCPFIKSISFAEMLEDKIAEAILDGAIKPKKKAKAVVEKDEIIIK